MTQRTKTLIQLLVLAAVAGGLGLFAYYGVYQADKTEADKKEYTDRLFSPQQYGDKEADGGSPNAEFTKLTVSFKGEETKLEREPGKPWRVVSPVKARADAMTVDGVVSQLQTQKFKRKLDEKPDAEALKRYGLDPGEFIVEAEAEVGTGKQKRVVKLVGGAENTFDGSIYIRRDADPTVYQAQGGVRFSLQKSTFDLRDKALMAVDEAKVRKVEMKSKDNDWVLEKHADGSWYLTKPTEVLADANTVASILGALKQEKAQKFLDDTPQNRAKISGPGVDAKLTYDDGKVVHLVVTRPAADAGVPNYGLREDGEDTMLAEMAVSAPGVLDRNPFDLKDKTVVLFKREAVRKVVMHPATGPDVVVEQAPAADGGAGGAWMMTAPKTGPAKGIKISSVLWTLGAIKYSVGDEENPKDWGKYGLDAKAKSVTMFDGEGHELGKFVIGKDVPGRAPVVYVRGTRPQVVETDGSRFNELPFNADDLFDAPPPDAGTDGGH